MNRVENLGCSRPGVNGEEGVDRGDGVQHACGLFHSCGWRLLPNITCPRSRICLTGVQNGFSTVRSRIWGWDGFRPICADPGSTGPGERQNETTKMKPSPGVTWTHTLKSLPRWENPFAKDKSSGTVFRKPVYPLKSDLCRNARISGSADMLTVQRSPFLMNAFMVT